MKRLVYTFAVFASAEDAAKCVELVKQNTTVDGVTLQRRGARVRVQYLLGDSWAQCCVMYVIGVAHALGAGFESDFLCELDRKAT